ncbi:hypothetical protein CBB_A0004 [Clostridium botulinum Bf]|nr:hypothetical protein CBB_A0004 [Clostridium botulinum Bf]
MLPSSHNHQMLIYRNPGFRFKLVLINIMSFLRKIILSKLHSEFYLVKPSTY